MTIEHLNMFSAFWGMFLTIVIILAHASLSCHMAKIERKLDKLMLRDKE